jgi:NADH dehydrogenase
MFLIEPKDNFVFSPLLYELAVGTASSVEVAPSYQSLLATSRVKHLRSSVESIDVDTRSVVLTNELGEKKTMNFDVLVMAVGIQPRVDAIPGAREHAIPFYTVNSAMQLKSKLKALRLKKREDKPAEVVVVGGGYGGVEVAANVAEYLGRRAGRVTILDRNSRILATSAEFNRRAAER